MWATSIILLKKFVFRSKSRAVEARDLRFRDLPEADLKLQVSFALFCGLVILLGLLFAETAVTWLHPAYARQAKPEDLFKGAMAFRQVILKVGIGVGGLWTLAVALRKMETGKQEARIKIQESDLKREEAVHDRFLRSVELISDATAHVGRMGGAIECAHIGEERLDLRPRIIDLLTEVLRAEIAAVEAERTKAIAERNDREERRKEALRKGEQVADEAPSEDSRLSGNRVESPQLTALAWLASQSAIHLQCLEGSTPRTALRFGGLDLSGVELREDTLTNLDFRGTILNGARMERVRFSKIRGSEAKLMNATLTGTEWRDVDLEKAQFPNVEATGAVFEGKLTSTEWQNAIAPNSTFNGSQLSGAVFAGATLTSAKFEKAS